MKGKKAEMNSEEVVTFILYLGILIAVIVAVYLIFKVLGR
jgi:hypothetical protein